MGKLTKTQKRSPTPSKTPALPSSETDAGGRTQAQIQATIQQQKYSGPIPHPEILAGYDRVHPGAAGLILQVFKDDSDFLRKHQSDALMASKNDRKRRHWMAFSLIFSGYLLSFIFACMAAKFKMNGFIWLAGVVLGSTLVGTIAQLLDNKKEKDSKGK